MVARRRQTQDPSGLFDSTSKTSNGSVTPLDVRRRRLGLPTNIRSTLRTTLCLVSCVLTATFLLHASRQTSSSTINDPSDEPLPLPSPLKSTDSHITRELMDCGIDRYSLTDEHATKGKGSKVPVLLHGWDIPDDWDQDHFFEKAGHFSQYVKGNDVQPLRDSSNKQQCVLPGKELFQHIQTEQKKDLLFFTNNKENEPFMRKLSNDITVPHVLDHIDGFQVFSAMIDGNSHSFHRHGESWIGQVHGRKLWWFLPPNAKQPPKRVNACDEYLRTGNSPPGATMCLQQPGDIIWFPKNWYHATCALDNWTVAIGGQQGPLLRQNFQALQHEKMSRKEIKNKMKECGMIKHNDAADASDWKFFDGDINAYYNSLEKDHKRNPNNIGDYAVHRWLGKNKSTEEHYHLIHKAVYQHHAKATSTSNHLRVFDGGCGLGSGLMWMEQQEPNWNLRGYTLSEEQLRFAKEKLPEHKFEVKLRSYDELDEEVDVVYSIEALIHSKDMANTIRTWSSHLTEGGIIVIIDDFAAASTNKNDPEVVDFCKSWMANSFVTTEEVTTMARNAGLELVENRDIGAEYNIIEVNYGRRMPPIKPFGGRTHQGWAGSKLRQRLTVAGKISYNLIVLKKPAVEQKESEKSSVCAEVPTNTSAEHVEFPEISAELMSGSGANGGEKIECISGWYCCNKGQEWIKNIHQAKRKRPQGFLDLSGDLFGHYVDVFAKHLNNFYQTLPPGTKGRFIDIGGTGSTASGMKKVTSKFEHFAGPLEYWILDSDQSAKEMERTIHCDICDCPEAEDCGFDVTFSHTVLEHAKRPWEAFDTIARITKKNGLTMHLVPFSYQYHATPEDHYRFSHTALKSLFEDRGFTVLEVGYDICTKRDEKLGIVDEHFDTIWLTYVVARKN